MVMARLMAIRLFPSPDMALVTRIVFGELSSPGLMMCVLSLRNCSETIDEGAKNETSLSSRTPSSGVVFAVASTGSPNRSRSTFRSASYILPIFGCLPS